MKNQNLKDMSFDQKLDLFSNGRCSTKRIRPSLTGPVQYMPSVAGHGVVLGGGNPGHATITDALAKAEAFKRLCREYPRNSDKAKEHDSKMADRYMAER